MDKAIWQQAYEDLNLFNPVTFRIDGYRVTVHLSASKIKMKMFLMIYVNGTCCGSDWNLESEIGRKFYFRKTTYLYSPAKKKKLIKEFGKRTVKKWYPGIDKKMTVVIPHFPSFTAFRLQIEKYCQDIEYTGIRNAILLSDLDKE